MLGSSDVITFIPTYDRARARAFYETTLGLRFVEDTPFALVFDAHGIMLRISKVDDFTPAPFTTLGWVVSDIAATVGGLLERGVAFSEYDFLEQDSLGVWTSPDGAKVAWFQDPDGNTLSLTQFPRKRAP